MPVNISRASVARKAHQAKGCDKLVGVRRHSPHAPRLTLTKLFWVHSVVIRLSLLAQSFFVEKELCQKRQPFPIFWMSDVRLRDLVALIRRVSRKMRIRLIDDRGRRHTSIVIVLNDCANLWPG